MKEIYMTDELRSETMFKSGWMHNYSKKTVSSDEALKVMKSGDNVIMQPGCATPLELIRAMVRRKDELFGVKIYHILAIGDLPYMQPGLEKHFHHVAFFLGANTRKGANDGRVDFVPIFLSEVPLLFTRGVINVDIALIHVSPPDEHGFCSYGADVGTIKNPTDKAKIIIAQINKNMPRSLGNSFIHVNKIHYIVEHDEPLSELLGADAETNEDIKNVFNKIGENVAGLIEDGSTLQLGIGAIPDSVLKCLKTKKNLGIHTEMFSDGIVDLVDEGVINNEMKSLHPGKIITGFVLGSKKTFNFIDNNPIVEFHPQEYVNDPYVIAKNNKMVAINSAIEIDLTGQVCADSIGSRLFSGIGGQVDFMRGAARSEGGKPIIALPSTTKDFSMSRIVATLKPNAGVVTSRGDVHYVVTEYGIAELYGKSIRERALALINIAHPGFREELTKFAKENYYI
jgi:acetyl-CoA hydrolase